jgi:hypothetical protein
MARQTVVTMLDDIDGTKASETVTFSIDGRSYEIDLSEKNAAKLRKALEPFTAKAREAGSDRPPRSRVTKVAAVGQSRNALIRAWAAAEGLTVPARGRIPQSVVTAYDGAH